MSGKYRFTLSLLLCPVFSAIAAQPLADSGPIIVTATRTAQSADDTLAPVVVIDRAQIDAAPAQDVAELLRRHAGLEIARNGGPGQAASLFLRGTDSNHTLVLVDGVKINPGTIGGAALQNLNSDMIERIEVVKGPRSTLYGSDAIGGVVQIFTRRPALGSRAEFAASGGEFNTRQASATMQGSTDAARAGVTVSRYSTDGFPTRTTSTLESGHESTSVNAHFGARAGGMDWELTHWEARGNTEYLDFFLNPLDQDFLNTASALKLEASPAARWATTLRLSDSRDRIDQNQGSDFAHTQRRTVDWQNDVQLGSQQLLSAGLQLARENVRALSFGSGFDETNGTRSAYAQDDVRLGAHHLLLAARRLDHESFGGHTTWDVEYGMQLGDRARVVAAAGTAFRAPDNTDRFGFGGNPNLAPETARNLELGLRHTPHAGQRMYANIFDNQITDLINYFDPDGWLGPTPGMNQNVDKARIQGFEAGYSLETARWEARAEAIIQDPRDESTGKMLARRAKRSLTTGVAYKTGRYRLGVEALYASRRRDVDANTFGATYNPEYAVANIYAQAQLAPNWRVQGRIDNLFDQDYTLVNGYNTAGRAAYVELRYLTQR